MPLRRAVNQSSSKYQRRVNKGLNEAFGRSRAERMQLDDLKVVILSDLHRGARDGADDFERCEPAYSAALGWYLEHKYQLWLLGDVEELWENDIDEVFPKYDYLLDLERQFMNAGPTPGPGLRRFYGNHDIDWASESLVKKLQAKLPGIEVLEALRVELFDDTQRRGVLYLAHGHQGTDDSDRYLWASRPLVRHVWRRVQRAKGLLSTTPAENYDLREKHDTAMFNWARDARPNGDHPVLVAGHTHHPVFMGSKKVRPAPDPGPIQDELDRQRAAHAPAEKLAELRADLELARAPGRRKPYDPPVMAPPCYFNSGCCCYPDHDVTGLEIVDGEIRLVRWLNAGQARPDVLVTADLRADVFDNV